MAKDLTSLHCEPCRGGVPPLTGDDLSVWTADLAEGWQVVGEHHIVKDFRFPDYRAAVAFVNTVAELAEKEDHHPEIVLSYGLVRVSLWTHKVNGLTPNDFILAAKIEKASRPPSSG